MTITYENSDTDAMMTGFWWAILAHPATFTFVYAMGFCFGYTPSIFGPGSAPSFLHAGGSESVRTLLFLYFVTLGILPLAVSVLGLIAGVCYAKFGREWR